jgi:hypothetical protein
MAEENFEMNRETVLEGDPLSRDKVMGFYY